MFVVDRIRRCHNLRVKRIRTTYRPSGLARRSLMTRAYLFIVVAAVCAAVALSGSQAKPNAIFGVLVAILCFLTAARSLRLAFTFCTIDDHGIVASLFWRRRRNVWSEIVQVSVVNLERRNRSFRRVQVTPEHGVAYFLPGVLLMEGAARAGEDSPAEFEEKFQEIKNRWREATGRTVDA
jgi:hypothetical protein